MYPHTVAHCLITRPTRAANSALKKEKGFPLFYSWTKAGVMVYQVKNEVGSQVKLVSNSNCLVINEAALVNITRYMG
jgi:hypothetical protein